MEFTSSSTRAPQMIQLVSDAIAAVALIDLTSIADRLRTTNNALNLSPEQCDALIFEYKRFLVLKLLRPDLILPPPPLVDDVWHTHILDTPKYLADCLRIAGYYIHHNPNESYVIFAQQTVDIYTEVYGQTPPMDIYPPLSSQLRIYVPTGGSIVENMVNGKYWRREIWTDRNSINAVVGRNMENPALFTLRPGLLRDMAVEVNSYDRGVWVKATVVRFDRDGQKYTVRFADGQEEKNIPHRAIRRALPDLIRGEPLVQQPWPGMVCLANSSDRGVWIRGEILSVDANNTCTVRYCDHSAGYEVETGIPWQTHIRRLSIYTPISFPPYRINVTSTTGSICFKCGGFLSANDCVGSSNSKICTKCHGIMGNDGTSERCICTAADWGWCG